MSVLNSVNDLGAAVLHGKNGVEHFQPGVGGGCFDRYWVYSIVHL